MESISFQYIWRGERGEGLYPRILYSDVIFCLQAGGPVTGRGGGGVRSKGGQK